MNALTMREREIAGLLVRGLSDKQIAAELGTSPNTVRVQLAAIRKKTGTANRTQVALLALAFAHLAAVC